MRDYIGCMAKFQKQMDEAGIKFDVTFLCGLTRREVESRVAQIIEDHKNGVDVYAYLPQD